MNRAVLALLVASVLGACDSSKPRTEPTPAPIVAPVKLTPIDAPTPDAPPPDAPSPDAPSPDAPPPDAEAPYVMTPMDRINAVPAAMVTRDGRLVLLRIVDDDGARGAPNLAFDLRDRKDRTTTHQVIVALDEQEDDATRTKRIAAAEKLIAAHDLVPIPQLSSEEAGQFAGGGLTIATRRGRLVFTLGGRQVLDRAVPASWKSKSYVDKLEGITCTNPEFVRTAYADPDRKIAVLEVAYEGTDSCWAPSPQLHVVAW